MHLLLAIWQELSQPASHRRARIGSSPVEGIEYRLIKEGSSISRAPRLAAPGSCGWLPRANYQESPAPREPSLACPRGDVRAADLRLARPGAARGDRARDRRGSAARSGVDRRLFRPDGRCLPLRPARLRQLHRAPRRLAHEPAVPRHACGRRRAVHTRNAADARPGTAFCWPKPRAQRRRACVARSPAACFPSARSAG